jgi:hypothetical protein
MLYVFVDVMEMAEAKAALNANLSSDERLHNFIVKAMCTRQIEAVDAVELCVHEVKGQLIDF